MKQCKACPWKVTTDPTRDIRGYVREKHIGLKRTIANERDPLSTVYGTRHVMACHESREGNDKLCVGWVAHQLGPGNNIGLRLAAQDGRFAELELDGEQHACFEDTLGG